MGAGRRFERVSYTARKSATKRIPPRLAVLALLALVGSLLGPPAKATQAVPGVGDVVPDFLGRSVDGHPVKASAYLGKVVVVSFWATWCPPCQKELPVLGGIEKAGKGEIQVIAVNVESAGVFRRVAKVLAPLNLLLANDEEERAYGKFGEKVLPRLVLVGRDGRILKQWTGYGEGEMPELVRELNSALAAGRAPPDSPDDPPK